MHGGFGGGHGGGGGGFGHGGGGHSGHGGGGHGAGHGHAMHSAHSHGQPIAAHNLGGQSQSILGHMTSMVHNGQGVLGHIAAWLVGQHPGMHHFMHHAGGQDHVGDASWASAALQVDRKLSWQQKIAGLPGLPLIVIFLVVAGWLFFLGYVRHGEPGHGEPGHGSPMPTSQEWRQQLVGSNQLQPPGESSTGQATPALDASSGFGAGAFKFGMPRQGDEGSMQPSYSQVPAIQPVPYAPPPYGQPAAPAAFGSIAAPQPQYATAPAAGGYGARADFSAAVPATEAVADADASAVPRRNFRHRVVAER